MINDLITRFCKELGFPEHAEVIISSGLNIVTVERDGKTVGILGYLIEDSTAQGEVWYVLPEYRKSNVAHELFNKAHEEAKGKGCTKVIVIAKRERARLYLNHGYQEDYVLMSRGL